MSFASYKKNRTTISEKFNKKVEELDRNPFQDDRFWELSVDKSGNGQAVIRWLPTIESEDIPFVQIFEHKFKGPGGWYIEYCLTTSRIDGKTKGNYPVCADNSELWNSGISDNKTIVSGGPDNPGRKRKLSYISNILVIKDPAKPENNGKVKLFRYGAKLFEKIQLARSPEIDDEVAINPFDMYEGANFNLIAKLKDGYRSYETSKFSNPAPISKIEKEMEKIYNELLPLNEFIDDKKFKSESDLETRFNKILGNSKRLKPDSAGESDPEPEPSNSKKSKTKLKTADEVVNDSVPFAVDGDDKLDAFRRMVED